MVFRKKRNVTKTFFATIILTIFFICSVFAAEKQLILIGVDGMQVAHYKQMLNSGRLPNFARLTSNNGFDGNATITGHAQTNTAPGNAELHTGLGDSITGIIDNTCNKAIPSGLTTFARLRNFNSSIALGLIYGKQSCYIPDAILLNAKSSIDWWQNKSTYPQTNYISSTYTDSRNVSKKALEFININKNNNFYFVVYYGVPDGAGHTYGENSVQYDDSLINIDQALGILLDGLTANNVKPQIIVSGDHGWNEGTTGHGTANYDTRTIVLLSNNASLVGKIHSQGLRKQCDIAPTTLNYFGMNSSQYQDITNFGCGSMINLTQVNFHHPADTNQDLKLEIGEYTGYRNAWKGQLTWPLAPSPPADDYHSRALFLWKSGEVYYINSSTTCPPDLPYNCWIK